ncbi:MAG TPA: hypothetical protein PLH19_12670 [Anaerolineae bacterium]|nr:hypothetical protein [Anaerolineae bacterium]HQH39372.1 hypothetical protein [Anaerolineae bacterium]
MQLFPELHIGLWNGWIFLLIYGLVFGGVVRSFPKDVIARLYDTAHWTPTQKTFSRIVKVFALGIFVLVALTPLNAGTLVFWLGSGIFILGMIGVVVALFNFRHTPIDQPATQGLYKLSRNPQWVMLVVVFLLMLISNCRLTVLQHIQGHQAEQMANPDVPAQARAVFEHSRLHMEAELAWTRDVLQQVEQGVYV